MHRCHAREIPYALFFESHKRVIKRRVLHGRGRAPGCRVTDRQNKRYANKE